MFFSPNFDHEINFFHKGLKKTLNKLNLVAKFFVGSIFWYVFLNNYSMGRCLIKMTSFVSFLFNLPVLLFWGERIYQFTFKHQLHTSKHTKNFTITTTWHIVKYLTFTFSILAKAFKVNRFLVITLQSWL